MAAQWVGVLSSGLAGAAALGAEERAVGGTGAAQRELAMREAVEGEAARLGLQPLRWPDPFPFDGAFAMRVATYAQQIGRAVPFAQAAFRQAYAGGRSLDQPDNVLIAAAACEMHPKAVLAAARMDSVARQLEQATAGAAREGVRELPAVLVYAPAPGAEPLLTQGPDALAAAASVLQRTASASASA